RGRGSGPPAGRRGDRLRRPRGRGGPRGRGRGGGRRGGRAGRRRRVGRGRRGRGRRGRGLCWGGLRCGRTGGGRGERGGDEDEKARRSGVAHGDPPGHGVDAQNAPRTDTEPGPTAMDGAAIGASETRRRYCCRAARPTTKSVAPVAWTT